MKTDEFWGLTATDWTAITSLLTAGLLIAAVVAALYAARQVQLAREGAVEIRKAQEEASRPYIVVTREISRTGIPLFDLVVKNIGQRPAVNVSIRLTPDPVRANEVEGHELAKARMLTEAVAMIAPGQEMRTFYDSHIERAGRDDLPSVHDVSLSYEDSSKRKYEENSVLDIEAMQGALHTDVKTIHHIGKYLGEIQKTLNSSSILSRRGAVDVEASVEPRTKLQKRLAERRAEIEKQHASLVRQVLPNEKEEPGARVSPGPVQRLLGYASGYIHRLRTSQRPSGDPPKGL